MENPFIISVSESSFEKNDSPDDLHDVIIIGGGPSGLTASIYASRSGLDVILIEKISVGGQIFLTADVENYPGFDNISGPELAQKMDAQAVKFGTKKIFDEVTGIFKDNSGIKYVKCVSGKTYAAKSVIISSGARYKELGVPGEAKYKGKGVSNCATCDAAFYRNKEVAVIGGGDTAVEEGIYLTKFASKVHIIHRRNELRANKIIQKRAFQNSKISFIFDTVVKEVLGNTDGVTGLKLTNVKTGSESGLSVEGVFVFIGLIPNTEFLKNTVELDSQGYIKTDSKFMTSMEGVFACGDCIVKDLRQVITAAGDGANAAFQAEKYLDSL